MPKKTVVDLLVSTVYRFCGNGAGVPGLPHEVTLEQAGTLGLADVLRAAIQNGNYRPATAVSIETPTAEATQAEADPKGE